MSLRILKQNIKEPISLDVDSMSAVMSFETNNGESAFLYIYQFYEDDKFKVESLQPAKNIKFFAMKRAGEWGGGVRGEVEKRGVWGR